MKINDELSLLTPGQFNDLQRNASLNFYLEQFSSINDILDKLDVEIFIKPGIPQIGEHQFGKDVLQSLKSIEDYWDKEAQRLEKLIKHDDNESIKNYQDAIYKREIIKRERDNFLSMRIRGYYDPKNNTITLFPKVMEEYGVDYMEELLISTLVHEAMHAYFNRKPHDKYPYIYFVEEPLAEFGMLVYLYENNLFYQWAYDDVKNKKTIYSYGATLMDQFIQAGRSSKLFQYFESYKTKIDVNLIPDPFKDIKMLPTKTTRQSKSVSINGQKVKITWKNVINLPTYFWDDKTSTLGLNGDWIEAFCNNSTYHFFKIDIKKNNVKNLYLGDCFRTDGHMFPTPISDLWNIPVTIDSSNPYCKMVNGVAKYNDGLLLPIYKSCGKNLYVIPQNGKWVIFNNQSGRVIVNHEYDSIWSFDKNGLCMVMERKEGKYKYGYVNNDGKEQISVEYDYIYSFENKVTIAKKEGLYCIINIEDKVLHTFNEDYADMRAIRNGFTTMKDQNGKWGAINAEGKVVLSCQYDSLVIFDEQGVAEVEKNGKKFKIDTKGNVI